MEPKDLEIEGATPPEPASRMPSARHCERCGVPLAGLGDRCAHCLNQYYSEEILKRDGKLIRGLQLPLKFNHVRRQGTRTPREHTIWHLVLHVNPRLSWCGREISMRRVFCPIAQSAIFPDPFCQQCYELYQRLVVLGEEVRK